MVVGGFLERRIEEHLKAISRCFLGFKFFETKEEIKQALEDGVPNDEIMRVLLKAFHEAIEKYEKGEYCIAHLTASSSIFEAGYNLVGTKIKPKGKVVIGTLGSSHYLGKDIVRLLLVADGFDVIDLGEIVFPEDVIKAVEKDRPDIVALSVLIIACLPLQKEVIRLLEEKSLRKKVKVMVGGAVTSQRWASEIGADGWAPNGPLAVKEANRLLKELKG